MKTASERLIFYAGLVIRIPIFGFSDKDRHKPVCSTTEASSGYAAKTDKGAVQTVRVRRLMCAFVVWIAGHKSSFHMTCPCDIGRTNTFYKANTDHGTFTRYRSNRLYFIALMGAETDI